MEDIIKPILIWGVVTAIVFAIIRELICWYYKINLQVSLLEEINQKLGILVVLGESPDAGRPVLKKASPSPSLTKTRGALMKCPSCGEIMPDDSDSCIGCGKDINK